MPVPVVVAKGAQVAASKALEEVQRRRGWEVPSKRKVALLTGALPVGVALIIPLLMLGAGITPARGGTYPGSVPGVAPVVLRAYIGAAEKARAAGCIGASWAVVAGIWKIESGHATSGGATADPVTGDVTPQIFGPSTPYGRAMGPGQFLPSSWEAFGADGDGDGDADPHNVFDAALGTLRHLCGVPMVHNDLSTDEKLREALYGYNHSWAYVDEVMDNIAYYRSLGDPTAAGDPTGNGTGGACPVPGGDVQNNFGDPRAGHTHQGNDIGAPEGTPIHAVWDGVIFQTSIEGDGDTLGGTSIWLRTEAGDEFYYTHNSDNTVVTGDRVSRGQLIGHVGSTGNADPSWPHVHFQYHPGGGSPVDPWPTLKAWGCTETSTDPRGG